MELEEGKMYTFKELAEWFVMKRDSFTNNSKNKLNELKDYAEFIRIGNRIKNTHKKNSVYPYPPFCEPFSIYRNFFIIFVKNQAKKWQYISKHFFCLIFLYTAKKGCKKVAVYI